jgi:hypothetical protein
MAAGLLLITLAACRKEPNLDDLTYDQVVVTDRDLAANFGAYRTYHISDTVSLVANDPKDSILTGPTAKTLVDAVKANMNSRGYQFVARNAKPDIGLRLTVIKDVERTAVCGGWWDGWWGYYPPGWWGYPGGGYYYPWCASYTYAVGTTTLYMYDLLNAKGNGTLRAIWGATLFGVFSTSNNATNLQLTINGINQAYQQSTYIQR